MVLYDSFTNTYYKVTSNSTTENVTLEVYSTGSSDIYYHISQDVLNTRVDYPYLFQGTAEHGAYLWLQLVLTCTD